MASKDSLRTHGRSAYCMETHSEVDGGMYVNIVF